MKLGDNILKLRKKQGLSQEQLGEKVNVTRQTISNWELNETAPNPEQLKLLSKSLKVSIDELLDNEVENISTSEKQDNEDKTIIKEKASNIEKLAGIIINILKGIGLLFIIFLVLGIIGIVMFVGVRTKQNKDFSTSIELICSLGMNKYTIAVSEDNFFSCDNCSDEMIDILGSLTNAESVEKSAQKIEDYFLENGGTCE
ncbi:MAG: helix-turn-helix domain-containing protein [Bacilli bacterium]|nr:helix-turn-helix domain-containing protein [Bacilli bacterium]